MSSKRSQEQDADLFSGLEGAGSRVPKKLVLRDGDVDYYPTFFSKVESDALFQDLLVTANWKQEQIKLFGKLVDLPRLTAWYGDQGKSYTYSGIKVVAEPWTDTLLRIKREIEAVSGVSFNSVLLNLYRGEQDSVAWHSDDEPELGVNPVIGSVSFGATRRFQLKHKREKALKREIDLLHGSYLIMRGSTQHCWLHQVPKTKKPVKQRVNLTFRSIV